MGFSNAIVLVLVQHLSELSAKYMMSYDMTHSMMKAVRLATFWSTEYEYEIDY